MKIIEIEDITCDTCSGYADVVIEEEWAALHTKVRRFLCDKCFQKELKKDGRSVS